MKSKQTLQTAREQKEKETNEIKRRIGLTLPAQGKKKSNKWEKGGDPSLRRRRTARGSKQSPA